MNTRKFLLFSLYPWVASGSLCLAASLPAGTPIVVKTNAGISTHATPGNHFTATLAQDVGGVRAGAQCRGTIVASRGGRSTTSSSPLTLVLNSISANGHMVKIKTNNIHPEPAKTTRTRRGSFSFGEDVFPVGTRLEFRLSHAATL